MKLYIIIFKKFLKNINRNYIKSNKNNLDFYFIKAKKNKKNNL